MSQETFENDGADPSDYQAKIGARLKELRLQKGLSQRQVASAFRITPAYVSNIESGRTPVSLHYLILFADLTGLSLDEIIGEKETEFPSTSVNSELADEVSSLSIEEKQKLIKMLQIRKE